MMLIEATDAPLPTDTKRFYFPACVTVQCPTCGREATRDFSQDYLSYPTANTPMDVTFHHTDEEPYLHHEWTERMILRITIEGVDPEDSP